MFKKDIKKIFLPSIDLESWVCSDFFNSKFNNKSQSRTIIKPVKWILNVLKKYNCNITFFVVSENATMIPNIIKMIHEDGHEIASHTVTHRSINNLTKKEAMKEYIESKKHLEEIIDDEIIGFRAPSAKINSNLIYLKDADYKYDASMVNSIPIPGWYGNLKMRNTPSLISNEVMDKDFKLMEFPISSHPFLKIPISAWWIRNLGYQYFVNSVYLNLKVNNYCSFYLHPWEFVDRLPKVNAQFHVHRNIGDKVRKSFVKVISSFSENIYTHRDIFEIYS